MSQFYTLLLKDCDKMILNLTFSSRTAYFFLIIVLCHCISAAAGGVSYQVFVLHKNGSEWASVLQCDATGATFGESLAVDMEISACGYFVKPSLACTPVAPPPRNTSCSAYFAFINRGNCTFSKKAYDIQESGYGAGIVISQANNRLVTMSGNDKLAGKVFIPMFMVTYECGQQIRNFPYTKGYVVMVRNFYSYDLLKYLIPFVVVVGFCFLIMLSSMIIRFVRDRRRVARRRLSRRNLRKLPTKKYKKGEEPETCPICLDDFDDGDKLRVLPCKHTYHTKCVDPWLTKNRKVCPVCKRKVLPGSGDSDSENEEREANAAAGQSNPSAPLLGEYDSSPFAVGNSTFYDQYQSSNGSPNQRQGQYLTPPSSPEVDDRRVGPSSSTDSSRRSSKRGKSRVVVPGFIKSGGSQERLVVPVPPEEQQTSSSSRGIENPGYDSENYPPEVVVNSENKVDISEYKQTQIRAPRRKRHAAMGGSGKTQQDEHCLLSEELSSPEDTDSDSELAVVAGSERRKQSKKYRHKRTSQKRSRKIAPSSAPASLLDAHSVTTAADINFGIEAQEKEGDVVLSEEEVDGRRKNEAEAGDKTNRVDQSFLA